MNSGKSADEYQIAAEHLKTSKPVIVPFIVETFNTILQERQVPESFKTGILTPVLKKGKDSTKTDSYRGITVTAILGKLFEYVILNRITISQSDLQFGFTKGLSPSMASLIVSEAKIEADLNGAHMYLATLDSQKAFDVVDHRILLDKLYHQNIHPDLWLIVKEMYKGLTARVKWKNGLSSSYSVKQGIRQGGVLSTHFYKTYINDLLSELEHHKIGMQIGNTYVGSPCCADDVALLSCDENELQIMLNVASRYATHHRYNLHPIKSKVVSQYNSKNNDTSWTLGDNIIHCQDRTEHLGLLRTSNKENDLNIRERISLARRTLYSLISTGVHGTNGLNPKISCQIYQAFVLPRLLYGLEVLPLSASNIDSLRRFHHNCLRRFQSLPTRTALGALHLLIGALPITAELHKRQLSLLYSVVNCNSDIMKNLLGRYHAVSFNSAKSFFTRVDAVLLMYDLPSIDMLQNKLPTKPVWKDMVRKAVNTYWTKSLKDDLENKSTVKFMNLSVLEIGKTHHTWDLLDTSVTEVRKGITKTRMLTGTYMLQCNKHRFTNFTTVPTCQLCHLEDEDIVHTITRCPALELQRRQYIPKLKTELQRILDLETFSQNFKDRVSITKVILDCSWLLSGNIRVSDLYRINRLSIELCNSIHLQRVRLIKGGGCQ